MMKRKSIPELAEIDNDLAKMFVQVAEFNMDPDLFEKMLRKAQKTLDAVNDKEKSFAERTIDLRVR